MPQSLRKACHACTEAKRRCTPQLPKCPRCLEKGLACTYDLEPVSNHSAMTSKSFPVEEYGPAERPLDRVFHSVASAHFASMQSYGPNGFDLKDGLLMISNLETFSLALEHFRPIPVRTVRHQSTPFVHARILSACGPESLAPFPEMVDRLSEGDVFSHLLRVEKPRLLTIDIHDLTFTEFLQAEGRRYNLRLQKVWTMVLNIHRTENGFTSTRCEAAQCKYGA